MANAFLNAQEYANVMLLLLKNQLVTGRNVKGTFRDEVTDENGLKINVKRPPRFIDKKNGVNAALATQDIVTGSIDIAVDQYSKVHISVGDIEYVQSYNELMRNETMRSAASTLAHSIDGYLQDQMLKFHSHVGTIGQTIKNVQQFNAAHTRLMEQGAPNSDLAATVTFEDGANIRGQLLGTDISGVNRTALERVRIPIISEVDLYATQQGTVYTTGTRAASAEAQVDGGAQNVNYRSVKDTMTQNLLLKNASTVTYKKGDIFTIPDVYAWDWRRGQVLPYLQQFTVLEDATAVAGAVTLKISPAIIVQGTNDGVSTDANTAFATVNSIPANSAALTFLGDPSKPYKVNAAWNRSAIQLVSARLHMPFTGAASFARDTETGVAIRYWRGSDISTGAHVHRWDMIYGAEVVDPFLGTRVSGLSS